MFEYSKFKRISKDAYCMPSVEVIEQNLNQQVAVKWKFTKFMKKLRSFIKNLKERALLKN